ncbi:hypothetical protein [Mesorhizobium sp. 43Arga]
MRQFGKVDIFDSGPPGSVWKAIIRCSSASLGLAIGGALGLAGTFVASAPLRETLWTIDGVALVVAAALLTMKYQRLGNNCVTAGS